MNRKTTVIVVFLILLLSSLFVVGQGEEQQEAEECGFLTSTVRGQKNIFKKRMYKRADRIALDNPKYQNQLFYLYAIYKLLGYKF